MTKPIALYSPSLGGGGAERVTLNLAIAIAARKLSVDVVLAKAEGQYLRSVPANVRVVDLSSKGVLSSLPGLVRYLRNDRPRAFLATQMHANVIALMAKHLAHVDTRFIVREASIVSPPPFSIKGFRVSATHLFARHCYSWADGIIAVSEGVANSLGQHLGVARDKIDVIYNPVVRDELFVSAKAHIDHPWFLARECPIILSVGRLAPEKDFASLIRAFRLVRDKIPAKLVIFGEGELRSDLETLIEQLGLRQDVDLPGFTNTPYAYMARASLYVLSSAWEGLPNTLIEAMALGTPVMATDCQSGPREILAGGKYGGLVPVGDIHGIASGILDVLLRRVFKVVDKKALEPFYVDSAVDHYLQVLVGQKR